MELFWKWLIFFSFLLEAVKMDEQDFRHEIWAIPFIVQGQNCFLLTYLQAYFQGEA